MTLLSRIKSTAKQRGISIEELARKASVSKSGLYQWDKHEPRSSSLQAVADVLGVSVDFLLGNNDKAQQNGPIKNSDDPIDLDKALSDEGMAMFDGQPLSNEYKKALLAMLQTMKQQKGE